ncbi:ABC transporter ATP-binding protein [bacterium]|nr:ABC transporter ATP-binding protein [bacterium]
MRHGGGGIYSDDITGKVLDRKILKRLFTFFKPYLPAAMVALTVVILASLVDLVGPIIWEKAVDVYIPAGDLNGLAHLAGIYLIVVIFTSVLFYARIIISRTLGQNVVFDIRSKLYRHLTRLSMRYFTGNPIGRLTTRVTNDVESLNELFTAGFIEMMGDIITILVILTIVLIKDWRLTLVIIAVVPFLIVAVVLFRKTIQPIYLKIRKTQAELNAYLAEILGGIRVVKAFTEEMRVYKKLNERNWNYFKTNERSVLAYTVFYPVIDMLQALAVAAIIFYGGVRLLGIGSFGGVAATLTIGKLFLFLQYFKKIYRPISDLAQKFNVLQNAVASSVRIFEILDSDDMVKDEGQITDIKGDHFQFKDVTFSYGKEDVLKDISFRFDKGDKIALVGYTGSGKSTIINLLLRFWDIETGKIVVDGKDIKEYDLNALRKKFGLVPQDIYLFEGSIFDNIILGNKDISRERVEEAVRQVGLDKVLEKFDAGLDHKVVEGGTNLSVGERQLISFSRILVYDPEILILDEPTSNIDTETEVLIQQALEKVIEGRGALMVAHRLSTIRNADRILVLSHGKLVEEGTHSELIKNTSGIYFKLYQAQK